jgi:hypothetical protein
LVVCVLEEVIPASQIPAHLIGQIESNVISRIIEEKVNLGLIHSLHSCD